MLHFLPSLDFVDACGTEPNCFTVIDSYSTTQPNGFTVWDTTCPGCAGSGEAQVGGTTSLNQTYGWGCESGDAYGSGTSFDGGGVGTNQSDVDVWHVYSAVGQSAQAPHQALTTTGLCSEGWTCESTDSAGNVYDGSNGWQVTDTYSCGSGECGGYGVDHSITQTDGTTSLRVSDFEVADSTGRLGGAVDVGYPCANTWCQSVPDTSVGHELAAPLVITTVQQKPMQKAVRPTPAHFMMTAHALTFGVFSATTKLCNGESKGWSEDFKADSAEAANTITPIGGYVLKNAFEQNKTPVDAC